ncbi:hypothetical protein ACSBOB_27385 [Mesorhizobium sp. ASY16-5R]|uniref:hypothetical protein n=1 Tax=Mesorhizobium sp. ASY16-5R TaxID=3445772 RepID=UPI003FA13934
MRALLPILLVAVATPTAAQTVDATGATQLGETLARYVGKTALEKGIVKVAPDGDAYRIDFDFSRIASLFPPQDMVRYEVSPYGLRVKPLADGTWQVDGALSPDGWVEISQPPMKQRLQWTVSDGKMSGVFDPALGVFSSATGSHSGIKLVTEAPTGRGETSYGAGTITMTGTKSANGGIDFTSKQAMAEFVQSQNVVDPEGKTNFPMEMKAASLSLDADGTGYRWGSLLDILAFAVVNNDEAKVKANQAELKSLLLAALPLWEHVAGRYALADLSVTTPVGIFRTGEAGVSVAMDGIRQDGALSYSVKLSKLEVASLFLPGWAPALIPTEIDININGTNLDLDVPARKLIEAIDLGKEPPVPESVGQEIAAAFMADPPKIVFSKSTIRNADAEIVAEGELTFPGGRPVFDMTLEAAGYDKVVATLQSAAASDPQVAEMLPALAMVKGFAKTLADGRLQWAINIRADGSAFVNGTMVKPADPVPMPAPPQTPAPQ